MIQTLHVIYLDPHSRAYNDYYEGLLHITNAYIHICQLIDFTGRNISRDIVEEIEAETAHSGGLDRLSFGGSRAHREAALSMEDALYLQKNGASYLKSGIRDYLRDSSQVIIEFNRSHEIPIMKERRV
ncbi:hypothetical protein PSHT_08865 [Puccinia striiformis]|uniref:Uncharacterized protein n=1 Tax=Puccinia striiformis TaxID=27350 RepID=A0A2S4VKS4_9BASI|nr:hypothetical protein PSHT_08865 [Puccinia striiformis]